MRRTACTVLPLLCALLGAAALVACGDAAQPIALSAPTARDAASAAPTASPVARAIVAQGYATFVMPLFDAQDPARFDTRAIERRCNAGSQVRVNGRALRAGDRVPRRPCDVHWSMVRCRPFGAALPALDGDVDMVVFPGARQVGALIVSQRLVVTTAEGRGPFVQALELSQPRPAAPAHDSLPPVAGR